MVGLSVRSTPPSESDSLRVKKRTLEFPLATLLLAVMGIWYVTTGRAPEGRDRVVVIQGGEVQAGDADPAVGIEDKTGSTGISCGKMCFILIRIETMDQERPVVLREAKAE